MPKHSLLAVFAHPDDELVVAPVLAKYADEGHRVHLLTLTAGEKGSNEHAGIPQGEALAAVREKELACATTSLGLTGFTLLHFPDQGFFSGFQYRIWREAVAAVRDAIGRVHADVVVTWGPEGGTGHPDHRAANSVVVQAFQHRALLKHKPAKLYYAVFPETASGGAHDWAAGSRVSPEFITTDIDCTAYTQAAHQAIECHRSQFTPESIRKVRTLYDAGHGHVFLRLAYSIVAAPNSRETDIFAGL